MNYTRHASRIIPRSLAQSRCIGTQPASNTTSGTSQAPNPPLSQQKIEPSPKKTVDAATSTNDDPLKPTHFKITLHRSAIGLPKRYGETLESLGIRRRGQTVFHLHSGTAAGKILRLKELVKVENVPASEVKTRSQIRRENKAVRGYYVKEKFRSDKNSSPGWMEDI